MKYIMPFQEVKKKETVIQIIQTLGFPIACVIGLGVFAYKFVERIQDENAARETKYQDMLVQYGARMTEMCIRDRTYPLSKISAQSVRTAL